jgi:hydroxymethylpyrimidine/phosphomethylpyrimidine kinase
LPSSSRRSKPAVALAIGGLDPSASAGILADVRTFESFGVLPLAVATALTVQSGAGCQRSVSVRADLVIEQIDELLKVLRPRVFKIGQMPSARLATLLAQRIDDCGATVVLDPVDRASGGGQLVSASAFAAMRRLLIPRCAVLTVNLDEASRLVGDAVTDLDAMKDAAHDLIGLGARSVVVKGGHLRGEPADVFVTADGAVRVFRGARLRGKGRLGLHGSGCAFAAAVAASLALGREPSRSVSDARRHVRTLLRSGVRFPGSRLLRGAKKA